MGKLGRLSRSRPAGRRWKRQTDGLGRALLAFASSRTVEMVILHGLRPGEPVPIQPNTVVTLADGIDFRYEVTE